MPETNPYEAPEFLDESHALNTSRPLNWKEKIRVLVFGLIVTSVFFFAVYVVTSLMLRSAFSSVSEHIGDRLTFLPILISLAIASRIGWSAAQNEKSRLHSAPAGGVGAAGVGSSDPS